MTDILADAQESPPAPVQVLTGHPEGDRLARAIFNLLPDGSFVRICIKPNWVKHMTDPRFPIRALVTSPALIDAAVQACIEKYPAAESIVVGDVPLQSCQWEQLVAQSGLDALMRKYAGLRRPAVRFLDLRQERFVERRGFLVQDTPAPGDPAGYREVILDERSDLDPISRKARSFRVSDYDPVNLLSSHRGGFHRYVICRSVLESDLFVNLPKLKTHQKAGITGALKNLVGINGRKDCLVHHRLGVDEFGPGTPWLVRCQTRVRELLQKRARGGFAAGRELWSLLKRARGIETEATPEALARGHVYTAAGSWYGNDTLWRMIFDLNRIIRYAPPQGGALAATPQRAYVAIVDGLVAGEGNGPLQPLPVESGLILAGRDPFLVDVVMARLMGFDYRKIPCLARHRQFGDSQWGAFDPDTVVCSVDGRPRQGLSAVRPLRAFIPPPGWKGHIEASVPW